MKNITKTLLAAVIILSVGFTANAGGMGRGHHRGEGHGKDRFNKITEKLDLSPSQQAKFKELRSDHKQEMEPFRKKMEYQRNKIHSLWMQDPVDEKALMRAIDNSMRIKTQMRKTRAEFRIDCLDLMTPAQRAQYRDHMKKRHEFRGKRQAARKLQKQQNYREKKLTYNKKGKSQNYRGSQLAYNKSEKRQYQGRKNPF